MSKIIYLDDQYTNRDEGDLILVLGNFDGFHVGHMSLFDEALRLKEETGGTTSAIIFDAAASTILNNGKSVKYLTPLPEKVSRLESMGIDVIYIFHMCEELLRMTSEEFLDFIHYALHPINVIVGEDYTFGYKAMGKVSDLVNVFNDSVHVMKILKDKNGDKFSTQNIIKLIENGDIETANEDLIQPYSIVGKVIAGKQNGRTIGFPTANLELVAEYVIPKVGVYAGEVALENGDVYPSIINVGSNPTVNSDNKLRIEAYLDGYDGDLYNHYIQLSFLSFIRDEKKFASLDDLKKQLQMDIEKVR